MLKEIEKQFLYNSTEQLVQDMQLWEKVYNITTLLVGTADSITPVMVQKAVANTFPANFTIPMLENATNIERRWGVL